MPFDPDGIRQLANDLLPVLWFDVRERFVPIRAEAWLTHASSAPWPGDTDPNAIAALDPDPRQRGTALCRRDLDSQLVRVAGAPNEVDSPLRLAADGAPDAIGNRDYSGTNGESLFIDFAGWVDPAQPDLGGDLDYLYGCFSEVASAVNHNQTWVPVGAEDNLPSFAAPQPPSPAVYCEIDWAGAHPRVAEPGHSQDWADLRHIPDLDRYLQVTYYYLFAARDPAEVQREAGLHPLEGQWMALSVFYEVELAEPLDLNREFRPDNATIKADTTPEWVAFSIRNHDARPETIVRRFGAGETNIWAFPGASGRQGVVAYVEAGSHALRWASDATDDLSGPFSVASDPWPNLDYQPGSDVEGTGVAVLFGSVWKPLGIVGLPFIGLAWLFGLLSELWDDDASIYDIPPAPRPDYGPATGAGHPDQPAAPGPPPGPDGWSTNGGSPLGYDAAYFDIRVISHLAGADQGEADLQAPIYWDYTGRWGIDASDRASREWDSGTRRIDAAGRSWAYWHANELVVELDRRGPQPPRP